MSALSASNLELITIKTASQKMESIEALKKKISKKFQKISILGHFRIFPEKNISNYSIDSIFSESVLITISLKENVKRASKKLSEKDPINFQV